MPWSPTSAPARQRYDDVWCFDENVAVTLNSSGEILKTTDGGANWRRTFQTPLIPPSNRAVYLRCLAFSDALNGWAGTLTRERRLFRTRDGGESWLRVENLPPGAPVKICGLFAASDKVIYGSGTNDPTDGAAIIKTTDGGASWQLITMAPHASSLIDIHFRSEDEGFVVGGLSNSPEPNYDNLRPVILHTQDGGQSWTDRIAGMQAQFPEGTWGWKIQFLDHSTGFVSLENLTQAFIMKTTDGGQSWSRIAVTDNANLEGIGFLDASVGWVGGWGDETFSSGRSSFTADGGTTWTNADEIGLFINRFRFLGSPARLGYASGRTVYRFVSEAVPAPPLALARAVIKSADDATYGDAIVPIRIDVPTGARQASIQIWNRFGKEIGVPLNERAPAPGGRTIAWDRKDENGKPVAPGFYIYRVTIDDSAESQVIQLK